MSNTVQYPTMATVKDAAAKFGISEYFLRNLCRAGKVRFVCVGNRWLVNSFDCFNIDTVRIRTLIFHLEETTDLHCVIDLTGNKRNKQCRKCMHIA